MYEGLLVDSMNKHLKFEDGNDSDDSTKKESVEDDYTPTEHLTVILHPFMSSISFNKTIILEDYLVYLIQQVVLSLVQLHKLVYQR